MGGGSRSELFHVLREPTTFGVGREVVAGLFSDLHKRNQMLTTN